MHRDLKPKNILLDSENNIKICDFGLAKDIDIQGDTSIKGGTEIYMSPEFLTSPGYHVDIWAIGCIIYELFQLDYPFDINSGKEELDQCIRTAKYPPIDSPLCSQLMKEFIGKLIEPNVKKRLSAEQALERFKYIAQVEEIDLPPIIIPDQNIVHERKKVQLKEDLKNIN